MSPSLKDVVKAAHGMAATKDLPATDPAKVFPLYVLPRHDAWMALPESKRAWTPEAITFANDVFKGTFKHPRPGRFSPSALGDSCERLLLFGFAGAPQAPFPVSNAEKMASGEFHHLRWQMEGLSAGYMTAGEIWVHAESLLCGGSADARLDDGSLFELKSTGSHLFRALKEGRGSAYNYVMGMHAKHKIQMEAYWEIDRIGAELEGRDRLFTDWGSLLYQDAGDPGALLEFRLHSAPERRESVRQIIDSLLEWTVIDDLPDLLEGCRKVIERGLPTDKELTVFNRCQYRDYCPTATTVRMTE